MRTTLRSLEALHEATRSPQEGQPSAEVRAQQEAHARERQRRIAALSPYKQSEYRTLECIKQLRESLRECDTIEEALRDSTTSTREGRSADAASRYPHVEANTLTRELARARLAARRAHQLLQSLQRDVARLYTSEVTDGAEPNAAETYRELMAHIEHATAWYRECFGIRTFSSLDDPLVMGGAPALVRAMSGLDGSAAARGAAAPYPSAARGREGEEKDNAADTARYALHWRQDAEFQQFFLQVEQNDMLIDSSLDRIHAGVLRLHDTAVAINTELDLQATLLNETEQKMETNMEGVRSLNRRVARAIRELDNSELCTYVMCLLIFVAVLCILLRMLP